MSRSKVLLKTGIKASFNPFFLIPFAFGVEICTHKYTIIKNIQSTISLLCKTNKSKFWPYFELLTRFIKKKKPYADGVNIEDDIRVLRIKVPNDLLFKLLKYAIKSVVIVECCDVLIYSKSLNVWKTPST